MTAPERSPASEVPARTWEELASDWAALNRKNEATIGRLFKLVHDYEYLTTRLLVLATVELVALVIAVWLVVR